MLSRRSHDSPISIRFSPMFPTITYFRHMTIVSSIIVSRQGTAPQTHQNSIHAHAKCPNDQPLTPTLKSHIHTHAQLAIKHILIHCHALSVSAQYMHTHFSYSNIQCRLHRTSNNSEYTQNKPKTVQTPTSIRSNPLTLSTHLLLSSETHIVLY